MRKNNTEINNTEINENLKIGDTLNINEVLGYDEKYGLKELSCSIYLVKITDVTDVNDEKEYCYIGSASNFQNIFNKFKSNVNNIHKQDKTKISEYRAIYYGLYLALANPKDFKYEFSIVSNFKISDEGFDESNFTDKAKAKAKSDEIKNRNPYFNKKLKVEINSCLNKLETMSPSEFIEALK